MSARPSDSATPPIGRLLVHFPDRELADGAAKAESQGYLDVHNAPPWDTWVAMVDEASADGPYLLSWVPPEFIDLVHRGIAVNPEECFRWFDDTALALRDVCRELRAG